MRTRGLTILAAASVIALSVTPIAASAMGPMPGLSVNTALASNAEAASDFSIFMPSDNPIRHRLDYGIWDFALANIVVPMGPPNRKTARRSDPNLGTRIRQGHISRYRLEGSLVGFVFLERETVASFTEYREDLQRIGTELDISTLPRNEQLAFWFNLHNVAMVEQIALRWPVRQPRNLKVDGAPLDDAKFITVSGVTMSPRDIREKIVFANWRNPKVIYGFWRGEIGGPALEPMAYTGANVSSLLDVAAADFVNSLRGTQKRGDRLDVSTLYEETRGFYFSDFETDLRAHLAQYADEDVTEILGRTNTTRASIREWDIADMSGGARQASYLPVSDGGSARIPSAMARLLRERSRKLSIMRRNEGLTGRVIFSNIDLPGDPPNKYAVE